MFEKALRVEPGTYASPTYEFLADEAGVDPEVLFRISPDTLASHRGLQGFFSKRRMWPQALRATEKVLVLLGIDPLKPEIPEIRPDSPEMRSCMAANAQQLRILQRMDMLDPWRVALERYRSLLRVRCAGLVEHAGDVQQSRSVEDESPPPSELDVDVATCPTSLRERLFDLTPERPWAIDLEGKVGLLGITLEGATEASKADAAGPAGPPSGFTVRYLWEVSHDLDPRDYEVLYRYLDADEGLVHSIRKALFPEPESFGKTLDGGIGTVLVHRD